MVNSDVVGNPALCHGNDGTANDGHDEKAGSIASEWPEFCYAERENAGEHNGIEETH
jgi:hypothetical protein